MFRTLFYIDENPSLDSPIIVRCTLEGRHCYSVTTEQLHFHQTKLTADLATFRLIYLAENGIWSKDVFLNNIDSEDRQHLSITPYKTVSCK